MKEEVELLDLLREIRRGIWIILSLILAGGTIAASLTLAFEKKTYEAATTMVINKEEAKMFYEDKYTQGDILMYGEIINTYMELAKSREVIEKVAEQFPKYSSKEIEKMVEANIISDTLILELKIAGESPEDITAIINAYSTATIQLCSLVMPVGSLEVIDEAKVPKKPKASHMPLNIVIGALVGSIAALLIIFMRMYMESTKVMSKEELKAILGIDVWAVSYNIAAKGKKGEYIG